MPSSIFRLLLDPKGEDGNGPSPSAADVAKSIENLVGKYGDPNAALRVLLAENYQHRDAIRDLKAKVPPEGAVVLSGDDAKRWNTYRELGEPGDLKKSLKQADQDAATVAAHRRAEGYVEAARAGDFRPEAFAPLAEKDRLEIEYRDGKEKGQDGKPVRVPHVKGVAGEALPEPQLLSDYVKAKWAPFLPALGVEPEADPTRRVPSMPPRRESVFNPKPPPSGDGQDLYQGRPVGHFVKPM